MASMYIALYDMQSKFLDHTACVPEGQEKDGGYLVIDKCGWFQSGFHLSGFGLLGYYWLKEVLEEWTCLQNFSYDTKGFNTFSTKPEAEGQSGIDIQIS